MSEKHFNLVTEPWIRVIDDRNQEQEVSLETFFANTKHYQQLAGEMKSQDLAILRFLLAILTTVYSRYDAYDQSYSWIEVNNRMQPVSFDDDVFDSERKKIEKELMATWQKLYRTGSFSKVVTEYLRTNLQYFDLFDKKIPFYQATRKQYDSIVPKNKTITKGKGTVAVKQMNRTISESNNKPDIFSPSTPLHKDDISLAALTRWLITYQNFTAVTDKTKVIAKERFPISKGWLYGLDPVFITGNNLFETLMLNMVLIPSTVKFSKEMIDQHPVWEMPIADYIQIRKDNYFPENLSQLYTIWSRVIHIEWDNGRPTIFSAGLPKLDNENAALEPMTTWRFDKKDKKYKPRLRWLNSLGKAMWRSFGQYVRITNAGGVSSSNQEPGIVKWLARLKYEKQINRDLPIHLTTVGLINDGNATSQSPVAEFADDMQIKVDVLLDNNGFKYNSWPQQIEDTVELTNKVGSLIWNFASNAGKLRGLNDIGAFANKISARFYDLLNYPFHKWLAGLTTEDNHDEKINAWRKQVNKIALETATELLNTASPLEIRGKINNKEERIDNIFIYYRIFRASVAKTLEIGGRKNESKD